MTAPLQYQIDSLKRRIDRVEDDISALVSTTSQHLRLTVLIIKAMNIEVPEDLKYLLELD